MEEHLMMEQWNSGTKPVEKYKIGKSYGKG